MSTKFKDVTPDVLAWRKAFLENLANLKPLKPDHPERIALSPGNSKIGVSGKFYRSVFVWNLPSMATCPGASSWCLEHCYNADARKDVFPVDKWSQNWWMAVYQDELLYTNITSQLILAEKPCAVRVHSSGDFFSARYIKFWAKVANSLSDVDFWAYTRSWARSNLFPDLEKLHTLDNVELFASWDETMDKTPPDFWRRSFVYTDLLSAESHRNRDRRAFLCPEQTGKVSNCASCGFCMRKIDKDILFYFH